MAKYIHKSIEIDFSEQTGKFSAVIGGKRVVGSSLDGMKKRIDKCETFQQFTALAPHDRWSSEKFMQVTIVGIKPPRKGSSRFDNCPKWISTQGAEHREIYTDTPETIAAITEYHNLRDANRKELKALRYAHDEAERAADAAISRIKFPE